MDISLAGRVAIITGAASGIGRATVLKFLEAGAAVVGVDRRDDLDASLRAACPAEHLDRLATVRGDVSTEEPAREATRLAVVRFDGLDVLINNAAIALVKALHEHTPEEWDSVMNNNVKSIYWTARHAIPVMIERGGGVILNTGSISGVAGIPGQGAYAASKGAVHQMTRQMAIEYARYGIRVNTVGCGTVDTPLVHQSAEQSGDPAAFWAMLRGGHPIGRVATADEVASCFLFLASDQATFFTGSTVMLDGGYSAR
jgi:NAD(P)-dependent dehydrogenase (short-subunit alcohol dehydrogenase family)